MKAKTEVLYDEISEQFLTDGDLDDCLDSFARGWITANELKDRLESLLMFAKFRAERIVEGPAEVDDPMAKWGNEKAEKEAI